MELFYENSERLLGVYGFPEKDPSKMFDWLQNSSQLYKNFFLIENVAIAESSCSN